MLRPRGRSPALASLNKALGREVRNVCSVRGWGAGYVELCGSWLCFKTIPHWSHTQQLLVAKRKRESWDAFLPLFSAVQRCCASLLISPSHYFWTELPPRRVKRNKKKRHVSAAKQSCRSKCRKKNDNKKSRGRFLFIHLVSGDYQDHLQPFVVHMLTRETHAWIPNVNI